MRRFYLDEVEAVLHPLGAAEPFCKHRCVAQGVVFGTLGDGPVALRWVGDGSAMLSMFPSIDDIRAAHDVVPVEDHTIGKRHIRWHDPICFRCGGGLDRGAQHCFDCGAGQGKDGYYGDAPDPSLGRWHPSLKIGGGGVVEEVSGNQCSIVNANGKRCVRHLDHPGDCDFEGRQ